MSSNMELKPRVRARSERCLRGKETLPIRRCRPARSEVLASCPEFRGYKKSLRN